MRGLLPFYRALLLSFFLIYTQRKSAAFLLPIRPSLSLRSPSSFTPPPRKEVSSLLHTHSEGYTREVAYDPERLASRTVPDLTGTNADIERFREAASVLTFGIGVTVGAAVIPILLLIQQQQKQQQKEKPDSSTTTTSINRSVTAGSRTASLSLWARSQMHLQGCGGPDNLAPLLLDRVSLLGPGAPPNARHVLQVCAWLSRTNFWVTNNIFEDQIAFFFTLFNTGLNSPMQVRTCFLDDCVEAFVREQQTIPSNNTDPGNIVILGSGYDTRCYRLVLKERNMNLFEVDAPGTQQEKKRVLRGISSLDATGVTFCPCDFETEDWLDCLVKSGLDVNLPTLFIWEGVTMYLSELLVRDTLTKVSKFPHKSVIGFDYINKQWAMSPFWRGAMKRVGEPFQYALLPGSNEAEELVQSCGLVMLEHLDDPDEMARRYLPQKLNGKPIGILGDYGGLVLAGVPPPVTT